MAVLASTELKPGTVFKDEQTYVVLKYEFIKKGRGQATIRVKVRNLETQSITEKTYSNEQVLDSGDVEKRSAQFLYKDDNALYFMDSSDFSQFEMSLEDWKWEANFIKEGAKVVTTYLDEKPISIEIAKAVELKVEQTYGAVSGNTATGATKEAVMETGFKMQVPLFIKEGEILKINTEGGTYVSRVND